MARAAVLSQTPPDWDSQVTERLMTAGFTEEQAHVTKEIITESLNQVCSITASTGQQDCQVASQHTEHEDCMIPALHVA
jgi:hypothetical protein